MLNVSATILRFGAALVVALLLSSIASAQFTKLDEAGEQLAKKLKPLKPALVAVADFNSPDGSATGAAHYFSWYLSFAMEDSGKKRFHVADHLTFDRDLERILGGPSVPVTPERLHDATQRIGADVVILGTVVKRGASYVFEISPFKLADSAGLPTIRTTIQDSGLLESLLHLSLRAS